MEVVLNGDNAFLQVPVKYQIGLLGLNKQTVSALKDKSTLDIGCGKGALVEYLREQGINCEGIDPQVEQGSDYLIKQLISGIHPMSGAIPRGNDTYEMVSAFQNYSLNRAFTRNIIREQIVAELGEEAIKQHQRLIELGHFNIDEGARVLKPGKRFAIYPALKRLEEVTGPMLKMQGISFTEEEVDKKLARDYLDWECETMGIGEVLKEEEYQKCGLYSRTVISK